MKSKSRPLGTKLWLYFVLFAMILLVLLWLFQIVFLQGFYETMKTRDIAGMAADILAQYGTEGFEGYMQQLTFKNALAVFITEPDGGLLYSFDEHGSGRSDSFDRQPGLTGTEPFLDKDGLFGTLPGQNQRPLQWEDLRPLPAEYHICRERLLAEGLGELSYTVENKAFAGKTLVYGAMTDEVMLYMSSPLDPISGTTDILGTQLLIVSVLALLLSFGIAYFISRAFSRPMAKLAEQAQQLSGETEPIVFEKGFCAEIDRLAETLDQTAVELSKVEELRRDLLANVSHDLRTPLTMIKAYTEMIQDISGEDAEKRAKHLAVIAEETERLTVLVNDILEVSALQSGVTDMRPVRLALSRTVQSVLERFELLAERLALRFDVSLEPDVFVAADERRMEQVLYNLIGNAVNFCGEDRCIRVRLSKRGDRAHFTVSDKGRGIAREELASIWDRYYKAKNHSRAKTGTGSGLGLSIVKGILTAHHAEYGVTSELGKGTTFWFALPLA